MAPVDPGSTIHWQRNPSYTTSLLSSIPQLQSPSTCLFSSSKSKSSQWKSTKQTLLETLTRMVFTSNGDESREKKQRESVQRRLTAIVKEYNDGIMLLKQDPYHVDETLQELRNRHPYWDQLRTHLKDHPEMPSWDENEDRAREDVDEQDGNNMQDVYYPQQQNNHQPLAGPSNHNRNSNYQSPPPRVPFRARSRSRSRSRSPVRRRRSKYEAESDDDYYEDEVTGPYEQVRQRMQEQSQRRRAEERERERERERDRARQRALDQIRIRREAELQRQRVEAEQAVLRRRDERLAQMRQVEIPPQVAAPQPQGQPQLPAPQHPFDNQDDDDALSSCPKCQISLLMLTPSGSETHLRQCLDSGEGGVAQGAHLESCPVCDQSLVGPGWTKQLGEKHVDDCCKGLGAGGGGTTGVNGAGGGRDVGRGKRDHVVFICDEKSVPKDDKTGEPLECAFCFDEFSEGKTLARLSCYCIFDEACITDYWKQPGKFCPLHRDLDDITEVEMQ
ncbi:hypothetical protein JCM5350_000007 [Sporobolomyces pararoseus]